MNGLNIHSGVRPSPQQRQQALEILKTAMADETLDGETGMARVEAALTATTVSGLRKLLSDLPHAQPKPVKPGWAWMLRGLAWPVLTALTAAGLDAAGWVYTAIHHGLADNATNSASNIAVLMVFYTVFVVFVGGIFLVTLWAPESLENAWANAQAKARQKAKVLPWL